MKIILYGNEFQDTILTLDKFPKPNQTNLVSNIQKTMGGIYNLERGFKKLNSTLAIVLYSLSKSIATILYDQSKDQRSSLVYKEAEYLLSSEKFIEEADWKHIAYIDHLPNLTEKDIKKMAETSTLSADFCENKINDQLKNLLPYLHYLFISAEDLQNIENEIKNYLSGFLIVHSKDGSYIWKKENGILYSINNNYIVENINPLGAGDYFASSFIYNILLKNNLEKSLLNAHKFATEMILGDLNGK